MIELISFILFVVISSFIVNGWYEVTRNGRIFGFWERFWEHYDQEKHEDPPKYRFPEWVRSPLSSCILCMASVYGTIIFIITYFVFNVFDSFTTIQTIFIFAAYLLSLTCTNYIVHKKLK